MPKTNDNLPRYSESKMAEFQLHCACAELIFKDLLRDLKVSQRNTKVSLRIKNETETTEHYELVHVAFKLGLTADLCAKRNWKPNKRACNAMKSFAARL